jgi:uncharacterized protein YaeQ
LKKKNNLDLKKEAHDLIEELKSENFRTQYFHTIASIKKYLRERISWSTRITIISQEGSKVLYSTPEFNKLKKWIKENFPSKKDIKKNVKEKDEFELYGYFKKILMAHVRRKLQIINYFDNKTLIFDYHKCLRNTEISNVEKEKLKLLYDYYRTRKALSESQIEYYYKIAKKLTKKIESV